MADHAFICVTCGTQYPPAVSQPDGCAICLDERQYVGHDGQHWTTLAELASDHTNRIEEVEPGLLGIGTEPGFAIAQRALLVDGLLWDCITLVDDETAAAVEGAGGIHTIAISHPHYYSAMVEWADRFDAPVLLHEDDRQWVMRPSDRIELWSGERRSVSDDLELVRLGGHFEGGTGLPVARRCRRQGRASLRRHRPGRLRPELGQLHVQLPEPDPAAGP